MKKIKILLLFFTICCCSLQAYEERNLLQQKAETIGLEQVLLVNQEWVKYPSYSDRESWDKLMGNNRTLFIETGEKYLDYEWKVVKATDYLEYTRTGNRTTMEIPFNSNLNAISRLLLAELAEGKGRFTDQLINGVFHTCEMTSWVLSAHLVVQRARGSLPDSQDPVIDLVSSDVGAAFSWIHYFMKEEFDKISPLIAIRLQNEIDKRILTPYLESNRFWWLATNVTAEKGMVNNWNPWCNSNVLQCFLLMEKNPERMMEGVRKSMQSVDKFINYTNNDGACEEGPSYWGHAAGKMYDYLQLISDATNGQINIFSESIIKNMGEYISRSYVGNGWVVNFADAAATEKIDPLLIFRYGKATSSDEMMQFAAYLKSIQDVNIKVERDMFRVLEDIETVNQIEYVPARHNTPACTWYPETEFCYIRDKRLFLATKGGYNDESHNHNDIGTFTLYIDNNPVLIDVGVGTYTSKTFSSQRYTIWNIQSNYHNLPLINGYSQQNGKQYKATNTVFNNKQKTFSLDIAKAYPAEADINKWVRNYQVKNNTLTIEEIFDINNPRHPNTIHLMTWGEVDYSKEGKINIKVEETSTQLNYDKELFSLTCEKIELEDPRLIRVWGNEIYRIVLTAKNTVNKGKYKFTIKAL